MSTWDEKAADVAELVALEASEWSPAVATRFGCFMSGARWQREALLSDDMIERVARELANLDPGDDWPTNIELGGNPFTGTRDDEYKRGMHERAREVLGAALGIDGDE